jgi:hypothetical protein
MASQGQQAAASTPSATLECQHGQCTKKAESTGKRCKRCVSNAGDRYCYQHK